MELPKEEPVSKPTETPEKDTPKEAPKETIETTKKGRGRPKREMTEAQIAARERNLEKGRQVRDKKYQLQQKLLMAAEKFLQEEMKKEESASKPAQKEKVQTEPKVDTPKQDPVIEKAKEPEPEPARQTQPRVQYQEPVQPFSGYNIQPRFLLPSRTGRKIFSLQDLLK